MRKNQGRNKNQSEHLSKVVEKDSPERDQSQLVDQAGQPLNRPISEKTEQAIGNLKKGKKGSQTVVNESINLRKAQTERGKNPHSIQDVSSIPPNQPEMQVSDEELMNYYEVDDLVFAKSDKGIFEPGFIFKVLKNYTAYRVQFFESPKKKTFKFQELKDYDQQNISNYLKLSTKLSKEQGDRIKKNMSLAEDKMKKLKEKERDNDRKEQEKKEQKKDTNQNADETKKETKSGRFGKKLSENPENLGKTGLISIRKNKLGRKQKSSKVSSKKEKESEQEKQIEKEKESSYELQVLQPKDQQLEKKESQQMKDEQSNHNEEVHEEEKKIVMEQEIKQSSQELRRISNIGSKGFTKVSNVMNDQESPVPSISPFHSEKRSENIILQQNIPRSQTEQLVDNFMKEYNEANETLFTVVKKLQSLPSQALISICETILDKLNQYVTLELPHRQAQQITRRYGNLTDLLAPILKFYLTNVLDLTSSKIIIKSINFLWHYQQLANSTIKKMSDYLRYDYQLVLSLVEQWSQTYEINSKSIYDDEILLSNRNNIIEKLKFYNQRCRNKQ